ncbi:MAG: hypothetical protein ACT4QE_12565, partial [Anaerolineales bacterium]
LDGASLPASALAHHNFGGGSQAELRVLERSLVAGSTHTLRVTYTLGTPQASTAGSYQPALTWSNGPRLAFNFGFTDLGPGRYLEAWVPANLIFDQFELQLELLLLNTAVAHSLITNGAVTPLGTNHWRVNFPARFSALSPLLELRATDTLVSATDSVTLPVSGTTVSLEAWKLVSNATNLTAQLNSLKTHLADNENSTGAYLHGNRFVAFFHVGGMEYEGGTTTALGALRHETFHSWWARGVKPASQPDAWFDEAWTVYNDNGLSGSLPFNFSDPPVTLCARNPWSRVTAGGAYSDGYRFWRGVAALIGVNTLTGLMSDLYKRRRGQPVTTVEIEEFLLCRSGNATLVDAFHRFVFGFENPTSAPDLWLRDDPAHSGADQWGGRFWDSPDVWVRNADDGGLTHQAAEFGQDNWFYARVRNRGTVIVRHFVVAFNVKQFAGTQFVYPADFLPCVATASDFDLAPGASVIVKARWPRSLVPAAGTHACLLAAAFAKGDHPVAGRHVWEHNNLAQKNLTVVNLKPNSWLVIPFVAANLHSRAARSFQIELIRPPRYSGLAASLLNRAKAAFKRTLGVTLVPFEFAPTLTDRNDAPQLDCAGHVEEVIKDRDVAMGSPITSETAARLAGDFERGVEAVFPAGPRSRLLISIRAQEQLLFGLKVAIPAEAKAGERLTLDLLQRDAQTGRVVGGIAVQINVV